MDQSQHWGRSRYAAVAAVIALHLTLIIWLLLPADARLVSTAPVGIELLYIPTRQLPEYPAPKAAPSSAAMAPTPSPARPSSAITMAPQPPAFGNSGPPVDWLSEAQRVAYELVARGDPQDRFRSFTQHPQGIEAPVADGNHHLDGESHGYGGGEVLTWLDDRCHYTTNGSPDPFTGMRTTEKVCKDPPRDSSVSIRH